MECLVNCHYFDFFLKNVCIWPQKKLKLIVYQFVATIMVGCVHMTHESKQRVSPVIHLIKKKILILNFKSFFQFLRNFSKTHYYSNIFCLRGFYINHFKTFLVCSKFCLSSSSFFEM